MRSVFIVAFLGFIVVGGGGYVISWYAQASETRHSIEQAIANINAKQKYLTYDAIETSGFPSTVNVSIVKPHFKGRVDPLFNNSAAVAADKPIPQWDEDATLDGKVTFGVNAFSNKYSMMVSGNWTENSTINGQTTSSIHQQTGIFSCNLQFKRDSSIFDTMWNFHALTSDGPTLIRNFRLLDCNSAGQKALDAATQGVLSSIGPMRLYATSAPDKTNENMRFYLDMADMEITPLGDAQLAGYYHAMSPGYELPLNFSSYGKQNIALDFSYNGTSDLSAANKNPLIDIVNKIDITNQVYNTHSALHVSNTPSGNNRTSVITFRTDAQFSEQYDVLVRAIAQGFVKRFYTNTDPRFKDFKVLTQKYSPDELYAIIYPTIPDFHAMGNVLIALDGNFKGSATSSAGDYTLNQMQVSTTPYGVDAKGDLKVAPNLPPQGNMQLNCANCLKMIDDMVDYTGRIQKALNYLDPEKAAGMSIDPAQVDGVKKFLAALSAPPKDAADQTTLSFSIVSSGTGMAVNGKTMPEVMTLYSQFIHPVPAAAGH